MHTLRNMVPNFKSNILTLGHARRWWVLQHRLHHGANLRRTRPHPQPPPSFSYNWHFTASAAAQAFGAFQSFVLSANLPPEFGAEVVFTRGDVQRNVSMGIVGGWYAPPEQLNAISDFA